MTVEQPKKPRDLVDLWKRARAESVDVFSPEAKGWLQRVDGRGDAPSTLLALRAIELAAEDLAPIALTESAVVATLPVPLAGVLHTRNVVRDLVNEAQTELLIVGFRLSDPEFKDLLFRQGREVNVCIVGEREDPGARDLLRAWSPLNKPLVALEQAEDLEGEYIMHGKVIVADRRVALVGSANFTRSGMSKNYEIGVRLTGEVPETICRAIRELQEKRWLVAIASGQA